MPAHSARPTPPAHPAPYRSVANVRHVALAAAVTVALAASAGLGGCGTKVETPLPDLSSRSSSANGTRTMTEAEQKRAIDEMIAKRDGKTTASK